MKVLHANLTSDDVYLERFRREAMMASSIDHENVVKVFEIGEVEAIIASRRNRSR